MDQSGQAYVAGSDLEASLGAAPVADQPVDLGEEAAMEGLVLENRLAGRKTNRPRVDGIPRHSGLTHE